MVDKVIYIIPARAGSKGFPYKNIHLFKYALAPLIDDGNIRDIYVTTDINKLKNDAIDFNSRSDQQIQIIDRPKELAEDGTSMKDVLLHAISEIDPPNDTLVVVLYPTYPERKIEDIKNAIDLIKKNNSRSLLCRKDHKGISPYLLMFDTVDNRGEQIIPHNLYRRQDYKPVFEISHFIITFYPNELLKLNLNLYDENTIFMKVRDIIDVDTEDDWNKFKEKINVK